MQTTYKVVIAGAIVLLLVGLAVGKNLDNSAMPATGLIPEWAPGPFYSGGPDGYGYYFVDNVDTAFNAPQPNWIEISGYGTEIPFTGDDQNLGPFLIGFTFSFYGVDFLTFRVCSNGFISFTSTYTTYSNVSIPTAAEPNNLLAVFWDDLDFNTGGDAYYYSNNTDTLIVEWKEVPFHIGGGIATFQAIITADGNILYQYGSITGADDSHTIGIENQTGSIGLQYIYNTARDESNRAIRFSLTPPDYGAHDILIVASDDATLYMAELEAYADIDQVDYFNARTGVPTLSLLQDYDAVVTWSNYQYQDAAALGNVLADYLDDGGAVVMHSFSFYSGYNIQGRLMDEYSPFGLGSSFDYRNMGTYDAGHPVMIGADSLRDQYAINSPTAHSPILLAQYRDSTPTVAYNPANHLIAVNCYVGDLNRRFSGDAIMISHNAINFAIEGPGEVLFLMADNGASMTERQLEEYWDINGINYYNGRYASPSLAFLSLYDAVVVWSNYNFNDATVTGNRLADYIDMGGSVVMAQFCFGSGWAMSGRLMSSYSPFGVGTVRYEPHSLGVHNPTHFLMTDVSSATDGYTSAVTVQNGGVNVASWDDSTPFVAFHPGTRTVAINAYYGAGRVFTGDLIPLLHNAINFSMGQTGIGDISDNLPGQFELMQNYPNPFNPTTSISFNLPQKADVTLDIYNVLGQKIASLPQGSLEAGRHSVVFDAAGLSSGLYFYRLEAGELTRTKKMVVLK